MHPVAKRCLTWAIVLVVVGALLSVYTGNIAHWWYELVGPGAEPAVHGFDIVMTLVRNFALPLAAGLVTVTILIQTLAPPQTVPDTE